MTHTPLINIPTAVSLILPVLAPHATTENHPTHRFTARFRSMLYTRDIVVICCYDLFRSIVLVIVIDVIVVSCFLIHFSKTGPRLVFTTLQPMGCLHHGLTRRFDQARNDHPQRRVVHDPGDAKIVSSAPDQGDA
jgi:hypothetical protein